MENNLYSVLIGIDDYKGQNLNQCVSDVRKVETYLNDLNQDKYKFHSPQILTDDKAIKKNVVEKISSTINLLNDGDVFILYYSGHGTQETAKDRFKDAHNGRIQCLVCHPDGEIGNALLADKELRYLFSKLKSDAHIVAIFDCCHSGEITRGELNKNAVRQKKRMSVHFEPRAAENFIFNNEVPLDQFKTKRFDEIFEDKNVITLSASASHQSSWEDGEGGVFTRNLLKVLKQRSGLLNYNDVAKFTRLSIQSTTREKQTPTIDVYGDQQFNQMTSWLNLHGKRFFHSGGFISYNKKHGWLYSKGSLHGIQANDSIKIAFSSTEKIVLTINEVKMDQCTVDVSQDLLEKLDRDRSYIVIEKPVMFPPLIFINDLDKNEEVAALLKRIIDDSKLVELTNNQEKSDFDLNIFNQSVYFSFDSDAYRPLSKFFSLSDEKKTKEELFKALEHTIKDRVVTIQKWHHYSELEMNDEFMDIPVKIELSIDKGLTWKDIFNGQAILEPEDKLSHNPAHPAYHNLLHKHYQIKLTNLTEDRLYITPIALYNGLLEISVPTKAGKSIEIDAGRSKTISNTIYIDHYMEVYNWREECALYKFIVNNHSDLDTELASMLQSGMPEPDSYRGGKRGGGPSSAFEYEERNAIFSSKIILKNRNFNKITGDLAEQHERYKSDATINPFIQKLYLANNQLFIGGNLMPQSNYSQCEVGVNTDSIGQNQIVENLRDEFKLLLEILNKQFAAVTFFKFLDTIKKGQSWDDENGNNYLHKRIAKNSIFI